MPLFMDRHEVGPGESFTAEDVLIAHELDLKRQGEYGVKYVSALVDIERQRIRVRVGMSAGEPVAEGNDLFGSAVNLASRICGSAPAGGILASRTVRELAIGKDLRWEDAGSHQLRGFDEPVQLYSLLGTGS